MGKIRVYTQDNCAPCKTAKYMFDKKGIDYEEVSINPYRQMIHEAGFPPVSPTFEFGGQITQKLTTALSWGAYGDNQPT